MLVVMRICAGTAQTGRLKKPKEIQTRSIKRYTFIETLAAAVYLFSSKVRYLRDDNISRISIEKKDSKP